LDDDGGSSAARNASEDEEARAEEEARRERLAEARAEAENDWQKFRSYWEAHRATTLQSVELALRPQLDQRQKDHLPADLASEIVDYLHYLPHSARARFVEAPSPVRTFLLGLAAAETAAAEEETVTREGDEAAVAAEMPAGPTAPRPSGCRFLQTLESFAATTQNVRDLVLTIVQQPGPSESESNLGWKFAQELLLGHREQIEKVGRSIVFRVPGDPEDVEPEGPLGPRRLQHLVTAAGGATAADAVFASLFAAVDAAASERQKLEEALVGRLAQVWQLLEETQGLPVRSAEDVTAHGDQSREQKFLQQMRTSFDVAARSAVVASWYQDVGERDFAFELEMVRPYIRLTLPQGTFSDAELVSEELHWSFTERLEDTSTLSYALRLLQAELYWRHHRIFTRLEVAAGGPMREPAEEPADLDNFLRDHRDPFMQSLFLGPLPQGPRGDPRAVSEGHDLLLHLNAQIENGTVKLEWRFQ
jgi:hypothetical protein